MPTPIQRGKAAVSGIAGTLTVYIYPVAQSANLNYNFDEEIVKDVNGSDVSWLARNSHKLADFKFKALGDTAAHAATGLAFVAPFATITLSGFDSAEFNTTWQNISGSSIDLNNTSVADFSAKFRAYTDGTQNTLSQTTPA